jgi:hypothetical protein
MRAKMPVFPKPLQLSHGDLVEHLRVLRCILEDTALEFEEAPYIVVCRRLVPRA